MNVKYQINPCEQYTNEQKALYESAQVRTMIYNNCKENGDTVSYELILDDVLGAIEDEKIKAQLCNFILPIVGIDCDEITYTYAASHKRINLEEFLEEHKLVKHRCPYHLEPIYTHIRMMHSFLDNEIKAHNELNDADTKSLHNAIAFHDSGKYLCRIEKFQSFSYRGHPNLGTYMYLTTMHGQVTDERLAIEAFLIYNHMNFTRAEFCNTLDPHMKRLGMFLADIDAASKLVSPVRRIFTKEDGERKCEYYMFDVDKQKFLACIDMYYDLYEWESKIIAEDLEYLCKLAGKIISEDNQIIEDKKY